MRACPICGDDSQKVIYLGLPMRLCVDDACSCVFGAWSFVAEWLPITSENEYGQEVFAFLGYDGAYLPALWHWLFRREDE